MTPEQEALREKVARNIERAVQMQDFGHWGDDGGFICTVEQAKRLAACCDDAAADAIAVVLKEAAGSVREKMYLLSLGTPGEGPFTAQDRVCCETREQAADFLLSLIPQEDGK